MNKTVLIIGSGPLPNDSEGVREAAGLRTHQFFIPIMQAGHAGTLVCIHNNKNLPSQEKNGKWTITRVHRHSPSLLKNIRTIIQELSPDVIIGVNTFPAFVASQVCPEQTPLWSDLNGWIMAEAQARSWSDDSNIHFANSWRQQKSILLKSDRLSTVSTPQKYCTIGEMSSLGLLQKDNFHTDKTTSIPNCTEFFPIDKEDDKSVNIGEKEGSTQNLLRGKKVDKNAIIISWIGGYNNWVDEETLFTALESAMSQVSNLYYVSTGGAIKNVSDNTFSRFRQKIDNSVYKERFVFLGWVETKDMRKIYEESDMGINVDFMCAETQTGARNRINEMMKFGLPVVTTGGSEVGEAVGEYGAGKTVKNGDSQALTKAIIEMANMTTEERRAYGKRGEWVTKEVYNREQIMKPVLDFIESAKKERTLPLKQSGILSFIQAGIWYYRQNGIQKMMAKVRQRIFS